MSKQEQEQQPPQSLTLPIKWHIPDGIQSRYATHVLVQPIQYEFVISFFEAHLPPFVGQPEETRAQYEQAGAIDAECVGRIIVAAEQMPEIIKALQTSLDAYRSARGIE